jgi:hypothetical protein
MMFPETDTLENHGSLKASKPSIELEEEELGFNCCIILFSFH